MPTGLSRTHRAVVFDFGGVVTLPSARVLATFPDRFGVTLVGFREAVGRAAGAIGADPMARVESGQMSEAEFKALVEAHLGPGTTLDGFGEAYYEHLEPNLRIIAYASALRLRGVRTAVVTNAAPEWEPLWRARIPSLDEAFDVAISSGTIGARKPDRRVYEEVVRQLGVPANACVFIDDKPENCEAAEALGMLGVLFRDSGATIALLEDLLVRGGSPGPR